MRDDVQVRLAARCFDFGVQPLIVLDKIHRGEAVVVMRKPIAEADH